MYIPNTDDTDIRDNLTNWVTGYKNETLNHICQAIFGDRAKSLETCFGTIYT